VGDKIAREKAGQALRDAIKTRRASEKKRQRDQDENQYNISEGSKTQHSFYRHIDNDSSSSSSGDEGLSTSESVKRPRTLHDTPNEQYVAMNGYTNEVITAASPTSLKSDTHASNTIDSTISGDVHITASSGCGSPTIVHNNFNRIHSDTIHSSLIGSTKLFESQLSSELEPRPISTVIESICGSRTLPNVRKIGHPKTNKDGDWSIDESHTNPSWTGASISIDEQKPRLLAQQTRSEESAFELLRYLLQADDSCEGNNDLSSYNHFFISTKWHSSHLDEFGFCSVAGSTEGPSPIRRHQPQENTAGSSTGLMSKRSPFDPDISAPSSSTISLLLDHRLENENHSIRPLLHRPEQQVIPTIFGSDQFSKMGRGGGLVDNNGGGYIGMCYPEIIKSNSPIATATSLSHPENQDVETRIGSMLVARANQQQSDDTKTDYHQWS